MKKAFNETNRRTIQAIMASVMRGDAETNEIIWISQIIEEFKKSLAYEILSADNIQTIQMLLSSKDMESPVKSSELFWKLAGRQSVFDGIDEVIRKGKETSRAIDEQNKAEAEAEAQGSLGGE